MVNKKAIDSISFTANKGEILGFLGPNGAGKTTTMKIISCFIPQTSGDVEVSWNEHEGCPARNPQKNRLSPEQQSSLLQYVCQRVSFLCCRLTQIA